MPRFPDTHHSTSKVASHVGGERDKAIVVKNRRHRYLDLHPEYFHASDLELAEPLLYDRLIRRFQSASDREREGRERGYRGRLEADLARSEAKLAAVRGPQPVQDVVYQRASDGSITGVEADENDRASNVEEGWLRWTEIMGRRFMEGKDDDFDYRAVDESEEFDDRQEDDRRALQRYLDGEEEAFVGVGKPEGETGVQDF
ncbi:hypothetical protein LTR62_008778 [Meristemomyces frigidus]|uniref:CCD97-like C-terminal domain-containing protein n=1 Tax=Meristemomyces frigidus TaxID=1508187 RepID=A0AAN7YCF1_9PEZI|nr:hypothetical protein LTR62_008778 [Meristemomyces frigidus]